MGIQDGHTIHTWLSRCFAFDGFEVFVFEGVGWGGGIRTPFLQNLKVKDFNFVIRPGHSSEPIPSFALAPQWYLLAVIELAHLL